MKTANTEVILKGSAVVIKATALSLGQALAQWVGSGEWPDRLTWIVILSFVVAACADSVSNFMSGTYERWKDTGHLNGNDVDKALQLPEIKPP